MKFLFVPVNYKSYNALDEYIKAIIVAMDEIKDETLIVDIYVADNSPEPQVIKNNYNIEGLNIKGYNYNNPGYLNAALSTIYSINSSIYNYIIISNVDVIVDKSIFIEFKKLKLDKQTVWIAPSIYSASEKRDVNPKNTERYSKQRLQNLRRLFRFPFLYRLYTKTFYKQKISTITPQKPQQDIYAAHGSFMIFTSEFFKKCPTLSYPVFLFCEEIFFAEIVRRIGGKVTYCPSIKIKDKEHASTSKMNLSKYCKYNYEALTYIINTFYEQD